MKDLTRVIVVVVLTVFGVHALAYELISVLPESSVIALGIFSAQDSAVEGFRTSLQLRTYPEILYDLLKFDLGTTLDRVSVISEINRAFCQSLPRILLASIFVIITGIMAGLYTHENERRPWADKWVVFGIFMPSFFLPLIIFSLLILTGIIAYSYEGALGLWIGCTITIAVPPMLLIFNQGDLVMRRLLNQPFSLRYRAIGLTEKKVRVKLLRNMADEIGPTFEKLISAMLTHVILAETIFGLKGIGSLTVRAVRRTDVNLLLGVVLLFSLIIGLLRILSVLLRVRNRGWR